MHKLSWFTFTECNSTLSKYYLEQSTTLSFFKEKLRLTFSSSTMLHVYSDIVLHHERLYEVITYLSKQTSNSKIFHGSGDKILHDLIRVPMMHQTCFKTYVALLIPDHPGKLKIRIIPVCIRVSGCNKKLLKQTLKPTAFAII